MSGAVCKCGHHAHDHNEIPGDQVSQGCEGRMSDDKGWCLCTYSSSEVERDALKAQNVALTESVEKLSDNFFDCDDCGATGNDENGDACRRCGGYGFNPGGDIRDAIISARIVAHIQKATGQQ